MYSISLKGRRGRRRCAAAALWLCVASVEAAPASSSFLTFEAALEAAEARSATLQAQDAATLAARDLAVSAGRQPDPVLGLSVDNLPIEGSMRYRLTDDFMTMRSVSLMQTFTGASKRQARSLRYEREAEAASSTRSMQRARLRAETARAWFDRYFLERMLELLQRQRDDAQRISVAVEAGYRGGRSVLSDVLAARTDVAKVDDRLREARADLADRHARLQRWVGDVASQRLGPAPSIERTRLTEQELGRAIEQHPEIGVMNARERVALAEVEMARKEKSVDWTWSLTYSKRGPLFADMLSLGVSVPLLLDQTRKQDRDVAAQLQRVAQLRSEREEIRRELRLELQRLLISWRSDIARLNAYDTVIVPLATQRVEATDAAFRGGRTSLAAVLEARRAVIDIQIERLRIEQLAAAEWADLEFLIPADQDVQEQRP